MKIPRFFLLEANFFKRLCIPSVGMILLASACSAADAADPVPVPAKYQTSDWFKEAAESPFEIVPLSFNIFDHSTPKLKPRRRVQQANPVEYPCPPAPVCPPTPVCPPAPSQAQPVCPPAPAPPSEQVAPPSPSDSKPATTPDSSPTPNTTQNTDRPQDPNLPPSPDQPLNQAIQNQANQNQANQNQNAAANQPAPQNNLLANAAANDRVAPGMIGDFFGGLGSGNTVNNSFVGFATQSMAPGHPNEFVLLSSNGGIPNQFQTGNQYLATASTLPSHGMVPPNIVFSSPGISNHLFLVGNQPTGTVLYNPPEVKSPPNPGSAEVYKVYSNQQVSNDPALAGGRAKIAENTSPLPRDRVFFNYSFFDNTKLYPGGVNVNRFTPGFEKTFFNGWSSFEFRAPFASSLSSTQVINGNMGATAPTDVEWNNVTFYGKTLLYRDTTYAVSTGLGLEAPTARGLHFLNNNGMETMQVRNDSVHILPFLGGLYTPNDRFFSQCFFQFDYDTNGNRVYTANPDPTTFQPTHDFTNVGRFRDATFFYSSINVGYWIYREPVAGVNRFGVTGVSPTAELHYNRSLQSGNVVYDNSGQQVYGQNFSSIEVINGVVGTNVQFGRNRILSAAYVTPLNAGKQFDGEFRLMFNWFFGGSSLTNPQVRTQF